MPKALRCFARSLEQADRRVPIVARVGDDGVGPRAVHFVEAAGEIVVDRTRGLGTTRRFDDAAMAREHFGRDRHVVVLCCAPRRRGRLGEHALDDCERAGVVAAADQRLGVIRPREQHELRVLRMKIS